MPIRFVGANEVSARFVKLESGLPLAVMDDERGRHLSEGLSADVGDDIPGGVTDKHKVCFGKRFTGEFALGKQVDILGVGDEGLQLTGHGVRCSRGVVGRSTVEQGGGAVGGA